jgi:outer membrane lipoprotein-sorting protein
MRMIQLSVSALLFTALLACGGDDADTSADRPVPGTATASGRLPSGPTIDSATAQPADSVRPGAERPGPAAGSPSGGDPSPPTGARPAGGQTAAQPPAAEGVSDETAPTANAQDAAAILRRTSDVYEGLRSLRADFTMVVENPLLRSRTTSRGTLYQRQPDRILLDFSEPEGDVIVSDGTYFWVYYPSANANQVIRSPAAQGGAGGVDLQAQFIGDPVERFDYTMHGTETLNGRRAHVFTLVPRANLGYRQLKVWIDAEDALVRRFELTELNGSVREFTLSDLERNPSIPDERFQFTPPPNARVVTR